MSMDQALLDDILNRLLELRGGQTAKQSYLLDREIRQLCVAAKEIFLSQPNLLELQAPIKICGDTHGQYPDLLRLFEYGGLPPTANYLFMGNYVDYGKQGIETICLLLAFKIKYPENFFLLRGNHECASINHIYGFYDECQRRFNVWKAFTDCFNCLPVAAVIDDKVLCMHGGLSPDLQSLDQIRNLARPTDVPDTGILCDLLWADPSIDVKGWGMNDRGISYTFGPDKVSEFLAKHDLDLICRSHQVVEDGYEFFAEKQLVTIFSAPNFRGEYDNAAAMMSIDDSLMCSFQILKPAEKKSKSLFGSATTTTSSRPIKILSDSKAPADVVEKKVSKPAAAAAATTHDKGSKIASPARARNNVSPPTTRGDHKSVPQSVKQRREDVKRETSPPLKGIPIPAREDVKQGERSLPEHHSRTVTPRPREKFGTSPLKGVGRPRTPARVKHGTSLEGVPRPITPIRAKQGISPLKGVNRPVTPARSVSPFGMDCIRPKTPPPRSQTPFRKEQKQ
ncbi:hypothetical protein Scep_006135 [Stephania cephalantha]|uniref:Serine/threonine-protein phosphatase n=1 Tax=Stephania cephalantha TaxID=152367 RepID=A0AAP0K977_9MAGN